MNIPSVPQGFNQLMVAVLLFLLFYNISKLETRVNETTQKVEKLDNNPDWLEFTKDSISSSLKVPHLEKQVKFIDSLLKVPAYKKKANTDSLLKVLDYLGSELDSEIIMNGVTIFKLRRFKEQSNIIDSEAKSEKRTAFFYIILSIFICFLLVHFLINIQKENNLISNRLKVELYKNRTYHFCQSCAKVFSPILLHGKNKDGTVNQGFCVECYDNGEFLNKQLSKENVIDEIKRFNPNLKKVEEKVGKLVRWNENPYKDTYNL